MSPQRAHSPTPILKLPPSVVNLIAAGEVAERPSVIVKELLENALDAGATRINIYLEDGGKSVIEVSDDGLGIPAEELPLAVERHATSKIKKWNDLQKLASFGFRGEALASIGSVSKLTVTSRPATQKVGAKIVVDHDQLSSIQPVSAAVGTTVLVENLFSKVPARRKFLKSATTELNEIVKLVSAAAMMHWQVRFTITHHQRPVLTLGAVNEPWLRISDIWGETDASLLLPLDFTYNELHISGLLGKPQLARRSKSKQFLFANKRPVTDMQLSQVVKQTYGSLLEPRSEPAFALNIELPPSQFDVNVHPRKEQVQFVKPDEVYGAVMRAVEKFLQQRDLTYQPIADFGDIEVNDSQRQGSVSTGTVLKNLVESWQLGAPLVATSQEILQIDRTYLVAPAADGLLIVDQHAAHERILYEQFKAALEKSLGTQNQQRLNPAVLISLSASQFLLFEKFADTLQQIGFEAESFGQNTVKVSAVPAVVADRNLPLLLSEVLDDLASGYPVAEVDRATHRTLAYVACRSAIKAGDFLPIEQRCELLEKLSQTSNHFTCPHGRPTILNWSVGDLEKLFKRK